MKGKSDGEPALTLLKHTEVSFGHGWGGEGRGKTVLLDISSDLAVLPALFCVPDVCNTVTQLKICLSRAAGPEQDLQG